MRLFLLGFIVFPFRAFIREVSMLTTFITPELAFVYASTTSTFAIAIFVFGTEMVSGFLAFVFDQKIKILSFVTGQLANQTRVTTTLDNFLKKGPKIDNTRKLVGATDQATTTLVTIQVNVFDCGALVIGVSALHKVINTCNLIRFINEWAGINRTGGSTGAFFPSFDNLVAFFPPMEVPLSNYPPIPSDPEAIIVNKRFLFDGTTISKLRAKAGSSNRRHSQVTLVTAVIWKALISIDSSKK
nr:acetyl-CoA-benzylalcohol acetyltransferase-like [Tanacetum cinerariifolium]